MARFSFESSTSKQEVFSDIKDYLASLSLKYSSIDDARPWGGFFVIDEGQAKNFISQYFPELSTDQIERGGKLSPKILIVEPNKRLSWQYHDRREELWRVISGPVGVIISEDDTQGSIQPVEEGKTIQFSTDTRHRLVGLDNWGVVTEIWQHTDPNNPSDEEDIVRVEDDFGR